jgi:hypothetical protein
MYIRKVYISDLSYADAELLKYYWLMPELYANGDAIGNIKF